MKKEAFKLVIYYDLAFVFLGVTLLPIYIEKFGLGLAIGLFISVVSLFSIIIYFIKLSISERSINKKALKYGLYVASFMLVLNLMRELGADISYDRFENHWDMMLWLSILVISNFVVFYIISYVVLSLIKKVKEAKKTNKSTEPISAREDDSYNRNFIDDGKKTPFQKTLPFIKAIFLGAIVLVIIDFFGNKGEAELALRIIGLVGASFIVSFFIWLFFYMKDGNIAKNMKKTVKESTTDFINNKPNPKDVNDTADVLLKYHNMLEKGIISQKEFDDIKKELLGT